MNQKSKIWYDKNTKSWLSQLPTGLIQSFFTPNAAVFSLYSYYERHKRYEKAIKIVFELNENLCSKDEADLILRIQKDGKISKKQYGWLKGILERQKV